MGVPRGTTLEYHRTNAIWPPLARFRDPPTHDAGPKEVIGSVSDIQLPPVTLQASRV
jgi:hypothetical protein